MRIWAKSRLTLDRRFKGFTRRLAPKRRPFFNALHDLLDRHPEVTLGRLLDEASEQSWGLTVLMLAILTFIPGVANVLSLATLAVGIQMLWGSPHPWLPKKAQKLVLHKGRIKDALAAIEKRLVWLAKRRGTRRSPSQRFTGFLVAWTAFLAILPLPVLPFSNFLPATALVLFGVALLEEWPFLGWMGFICSLGTTLYFGVSFEVALHAIKLLLKGVME